MFKKIGLSIFVIITLTLIVSYFFYQDFHEQKFAALRSNSKVVETEVGLIEYQLNGDSGPFVLFLHGTPGGYDQGLSLPGYRVLSPSRPGYLRTSLDVGITPSEQAYAYTRLLDELDIDRVVVMGASGGGPSSIAFASSYPDRTLALIALEAVSQSMSGEQEPAIPFFMKSDYMMWFTLTLINKMMGAEGIVTMLVPGAENQQLILNDPVKLAQIESLFWSMWPISQRQKGMENDTRQFRIIGIGSEKIVAPTLIIHGTEDINVPIKQSELLNSQISGSIFHIINGGDHMMPFSHSEEVDRTIELFISELNLN